MPLNASKRRLGFMSLVGASALVVALVAATAFGIGFVAGTMTSRTGGTGKANLASLQFGEPVTGYGTFALPSGDRLVVWKEQASLIRCRLESADGQVLVQSYPEFNPSDAMKWGIVVDSGRWLWFNSSDIGNVVWVPDDSGQYTKCISDGTGVDPAIRARRPTNLPWRH